MTVPITAQAVRRRRIGPRRTGAWIGGAIVLLLFAYLYLPPIVMAVFSFNSSRVQTLPLTGFTLDWYVKLAQNAELMSAFGQSLRVSSIAVLASLVIGTLFSLIFWRAFRGSRILQGLLALPMLLPGMVLGVALQLTFRLIGLPPSLLTLVIAHTVFILPVVVFVVSQRLSTFDPALLQASQDLGATPFRTFFTVVLPLLRSALIAAALLGFTLSFDELAVSFFVSGFDQTLPVYVWSLLRIGFDPQVNAVFTILAVFSVVSVLVAARVLRGSRRSRRAR